MHAVPSNTGAAVMARLSAGGSGQASSSEQLLELTLGRPRGTGTDPDQSIPPQPQQRHHSEATNVQQVFGQQDGSPLDSGCSSFAFDSPTRGLLGTQRPGAGDGGYNDAAPPYGRAAAERPADPAMAARGRAASASAALIGAPSPSLHRQPPSANKGVSWAEGSRQPVSAKDSQGHVPLPDLLDPDLDLGGDSLLASVNAQLDQVAARLGLLGAEGALPEYASPARPRLASSPPTRMTATLGTAQPGRRTQSVAATPSGPPKGGTGASRVGSILLQQQAQVGGGGAAGGGQQRSLVDLERLLHGAMGGGGVLNTDPRSAKREFPLL